jgi:hypothetical protein
MAFWSTATAHYTWGISLGVTNTRCAQPRRVRQRATVDRSVGRNTQDVQDIELKTPKSL